MVGPYWHTHTDAFHILLVSTKRADMGQGLIWADRGLIWESQVDMGYDTKNGIS